MQHVGDLIVSDNQETFGQVTGTTYVRSGGVLIARGQLSGGLIIEAGGQAIVHSQVSRNVLNHGTLELLGQVSGKVIGNPPINVVRPAQIVGTDLEVPLRGKTTSWTYTG
ncbi:MAG: hypothetical protein WC749_00450 [Dehalococcoidia bacterium]|uniref:hypothetical protein n=1 Tax=unclassified Pseudomonas TaxID=196821 RepID=UPI0014765F76|nr:MULTISPECIES: hypothetical protein [unclassified Pseudomonas]NMX92581.1 hypothetical protein [Pseudomonas sp. WS 5086]NMY47140.1 hypothetical protein [Pseudomonas sp. WS 5027]